MNLESLATKRARERGYHRDCAWYCDFSVSPISGLEPEAGVHRRDPSRVLRVDGTYYVWYTKSVGRHLGFSTGDFDAKVFPWDKSDIWYATSEDGQEWREAGCALARGERGRFDDRSVFTPEVLEHEGRFYLVYQVVKHPYVNRVKEHIAMAIAESADGPFVKLPAPILKTAENGVWDGDEDNRFLVKEQGDFDSHKVHDPCLLYFNGKFYLYYKGERMGERLYMGGRETKWGVAISDKPGGPYLKSPYNPVTNSGHETCVWNYRGGVAALLRTDGMERNTIQYADDGINFVIMAGIKGSPEAPGPFVSGTSDKPLDGIRWGLSHDVSREWHYIVRFDLDERQKQRYLERVKYE